MKGLKMNKNAKKPSRNKACPCGSGKKFKRCCGKSEEPGNQPEILEGPGLNPVAAQAIFKNEFRNQVDPYLGIPGAELVRRDQMVLLAKLECTFGMVDNDTQYFQNTIKAFTDLKLKIQKMQICPERGPTLTDIEAQIVEFTKRAKTVGFTRTNFLTLCALRSVLGESEHEPASVPESENTVEDDKVIEQALLSGDSGMPSNRKGDGPIEDGGGGNPDGDFQNEPPDAVEQQALGNIK